MAIKFFLSSGFSLFRFRLTIHVWGGLGSQLFACLVAKRLAVRFPKRKISLVFHSAGVTARKIEVPTALYSDFSYIFLDDYSLKDAELHDSTKYRRSSYRGMVSWILVKLGLLMRLNEDYEFKFVRPWLRSVRGHYSYIKLTQREIDWLIDSLGILSQGLAATSSTTLAIHFRLGDLRTLRSKSHISIQRIYNAIKSFGEIRKLVVYSDSQESEVIELLGDLRNEFEIEIFHFEPLETLRNLMNFENFIGTNSKISLWASVFRQAKIEDSKSALPKEICKQALEMNTGWALGSISNF